MLRLETPNFHILRGDAPSIEDKWGNALDALTTFCQQRGE